MLNKQMKAFVLSMRDSKGEGAENTSLGEGWTSQNLTSNSRWEVSATLFGGGDGEPS